MHFASGRTWQPTDESHQVKHRDEMVRPQSKLG